MILDLTLTSFPRYNFKYTKLKPYLICRDRTTSAILNSLGVVSKAQDNGEAEILTGVLT